MLQKFRPISRQKFQKMVLEYISLLHDQAISVPKARKSKLEDKALTEAIARKENEIVYALSCMAVENTLKVKERRKAMLSEKTFKELRHRIEKNTENSFKKWKAGVEKEIGFVPIQVEAIYGRTRYKVLSGFSSKKAVEKLMKKYDACARAWSKRTLKGRLKNRFRNFFRKTRKIVKKRKLV